MTHPLQTGRLALAANRGAYQRLVVAFAPLVACCHWFALASISVSRLEIPLVKPIGAAFHVNITCRLVLSRGERWEMARGAVSEAPNIS